LEFIDNSRFSANRPVLIKRENSPKKIDANLNTRIVHYYIYLFAYVKAGNHLILLVKVYLEAIF